MDTWAAHHATVAAAHATAVLELQRRRHSGGLVQLLKSEEVTRMHAFMAVLTGGELSLYRQAVQSILTGLQARLRGQDDGSARILSNYLSALQRHVEMDVDPPTPPSAPVAVQETSIGSVASPSVVVRRSVSEEGVSRPRPAALAEMEDINYESEISGGSYRIEREDPLARSAGDPLAQSYGRKLGGLLGHPRGREGVGENL